MDAAIWSILHIMSSNGFFRISIGKAQTAPRYPCASIIGRPFASTAREHIGLVHADPGVLAYDPTFAVRGDIGILPMPWKAMALQTLKIMGKMPMPQYLKVSARLECGGLPPLFSRRAAPKSRGVDVARTDDYPAKRLIRETGGLHPPVSGYENPLPFEEMRTRSLWYVTICPERSGNCPQNAASVNPDILQLSNGGHPTPAQTVLQAWIVILR